MELLQNTTKDVLIYQFTEVPWAKFTTRVGIEGKPYARGAAHRVVEGLSISLREKNETPPPFVLSSQRS